MKKKIIVFISLFTCILSFGIGLNANASSKLTGTVVPNSGYVENIYFNTNLTVDEVVNLLNNITFSIDGVCEPLLLSDNNSIMIFNEDGVLTIQDDMSNDFYFVNVDLDLGFIGWNPNITYPLFINSVLIAEMEGYIFGSQNDKISSLFSTTPFVEENTSEETFTKEDLENAYNQGYNAGLLDGGKNAELKSILGPLYNGEYFGYINGDSSIISTVSQFNSEYENFLVGNEIKLSDFVDTISSDIDTATRYDICLILGQSTKLSEIDLSIRGVNKISYFYNSINVYDVSIVDYRSLTNHSYSIDRYVNMINLTILDYEEFTKCDGTLIFNGLNELYLNGYNDGYANGYNGGLNDDHNNKANYESGYKEGYDLAIDESKSKIEDSYNDGVDYGYASGYNDGYSNGLENSADDYETGYHDGFEVGHAQGIIEKNPVTFKSLFWTIATVPFESFKQIWTVEFLGFNIAQFLTGLLMSLITLWVIKKVLL